MKKFIKDSTNNKAIANFQKVVLEKKALKEVKGGKDIIIVEELAGG